MTRFWAALAVCVLGVAPACAADPAPKLPAGYLSTRGNQIVDQAGTPVRIAGVNWFGTEYGAAPDGVSVASSRAILQAMAKTGFNTVRLPFSIQGLSHKVSADYAKHNPEMVGLTGLQAMDLVVAQAGELGLKIILDAQRSGNGGGPNENGLWYDRHYIVPRAGRVAAHQMTQQDWVDSWAMLAAHFAGNATVVAADLCNEPYRASWGGGGPRDWHAAATLAGNAVHRRNPDLLIIVEGVSQMQAAEYGEDLSGVASLPVVLLVPHKVVYSPHVYPTSVVGPKSGEPNGLAQTWTRMWGFIYERDLAPIYVGEYGAPFTRTTAEADTIWMRDFAAYLTEMGAHAKALRPSASVWAWNNNEGSGLGLSQADWLTPDPVKLQAIKPFF